MNATQQAIRRAEQSAGEEWMESAYSAARLFVRWNKREFNGMPFVAETMRLWVQSRIDPPSDDRSWGPLVQRLIRDGIIVKAGFGRAVSSHRSVKATYRGAS